MMPLASVDLGKEVTILSCNIKGDLKKRTDSLGLIPGEELRRFLRTIVEL